MESLPFPDLRRQLGPSFVHDAADVTADDVEPDVDAALVINAHRIPALLHIHAARSDIVERDLGPLYASVTDVPFGYWVAGECGRGDRRCPRLKRRCLRVLFRYIIFHL